MTTGSTKEMDLDGFLGHTTRGPSAQFLDGWKKRTPPTVRIVLHTKASIIAVWQHPWPKIVERERDGKQVREVWSGQFNSWETEDVLKQQYKRDDSGMRELPPQLCPMSIMLEEVYRLWKDGTLAWDDELFRFVGDDPTKAKVLHVAGMLNKIKDVWEDLEDDEKKAARKKGVPGPADAWMETMLAKCSYIFCVVDYDHPKDGIQIARETTLVGDKMKKVIRDRMTSEGEAAGHPYKKPYVFQWTHDANAKQFNDKYDVVPIGPAVLPITEPIRALIYDKPAPDISRYVAKGNVNDLRASMEDAYCGPEGVLDFDFIFARAEALEEQAAEPADDDTESASDIADDIAGTDEDEAAVEPPPKTAPKGAAAKPATTKPSSTKAAETPPPADDKPKGPPTRTRKPATPPPDPKYVSASTDDEGRSFAADGMELFACEACQTIMRADEAKCRKCGAEYEVEGEAEEETEEEAPPPPKTSPKPGPGATRPAGAQAGAKPGPNGKTAAKPGPAGAAAGAAAKARGTDKLGF